jgi:VanZ family protein
VTAVLALWLPVAGYMAGIFWLSSQSMVPGASVLPDWLNHDWLHHGAGFAGLAMVIVRALTGGRLAEVGAASLAGAWTIATVDGFTDEWHQSFVPGRMADPRDLVADGVGAALGLGLVWAWSIIRRHHDL